MLVDEAPRVGALGSVRVDSEAVLEWVEMGLRWNQVELESKEPFKSSQWDSDGVTP